MKRMIVAVVGVFLREMKYNMSCKHAYLIEAHKDDYVFYSLLKILDHGLNDIFIHMNVKNVGFNTEQAKKPFIEVVFFHPTYKCNVGWV